MPYKHVDESREGEDLVIGHKRLEIEGAKVFFIKAIGAITSLMIWYCLSKFSKIMWGTTVGEILAYAAPVVAILWGLFVFVEISTIYYSVGARYDTKTIKLMYRVFFVFLALTVLIFTGVLDKTLIWIFRNKIDAIIVILSLYILYRAIKKLKKKKKYTVKQIENVN